MADQALRDVRVVDLTHHVAGPYCTKMLADFGAEVIKVEPPWGDPARRIGPFAGDDPRIEKSGLFFHLNTNKLGVTLNLKTETGRAILRRLIADADILVNNFAPRVMPSLGLDDAALWAINPRLVITHITNFGRTGPYRDYRASDLILYALGGSMQSTGLAGREPVRLADGLMLYHGGNTAAAVTLATYVGVRRQGRGRSIDVSLFETQAGGADRRATEILAYEYHGIPMERTELVVGILPAGYFPAADGYVYFMILNQWWPRVARMLGRPDLLTDPRWTMPDGLFNPDAKEELDALFYVWVAERTKQQVMAEAQAARVAGTAVNDVSDLLEDPHFRARGFWAEYDHPVIGRVTTTGAPARLSEGGWQARFAAPLLGQHNAVIYGDRLGYSGEDLVRLRELNII
ncbi:MAG TPA: CoA transferase [Dehalococcoidia bacterium]|nr:CoA transferase [Dehalococcoidia bacterium]